MDDESHRKNSSAALKIALVALGVLVLLGVVQAATAGTVGIGALSIQLRDEPAPTTTQRTALPGAGLEAALGGATTDGDAPTSAPEKVVTGSWKQARGLLTVEVTKVESVSGRLRVHVTAINASTSKMDMPLASVSATDDAGLDYTASLSTSKWSASVPKGNSTSGYLELNQRPGPDSGVLTLTFAGIVGQLAPTGGSVSVSGIPLPK
ncbi:hypothetical protein [Saccharothrix coeruleofusca]|uniref:DUF4352 domain-containing protein n=1 Tax=Saccharothrix coeruleofusca TaxID=33919 RepID=A0A918EDM9_9PSEU|nr:hypothetical protein [Saccharothrix coeruleofusca]GGP45480.1 hypothetical protein GCM10010185_16580 [Saccharothrix coeruleofusca]